MNAHKLLYITLFCKTLQSAVNCDVRLLFHSTVNPAAIHKSSLDGGDDEVIVSSDTILPRSLTVDYRSTSTLYWCDYSECTVHMLFIILTSPSKYSTYKGLKSYESCALGGVVFALLKQVVNMFRCPGKLNKFTYIVCKSLVMKLSDV